MTRRRPIRALRRAILGLRKLHEPVGVILMYHRVTPGGVDPWQLGVSPAHFAEHLDVIRRIAHPISLTALVNDIRQRRVRDRCIVLTFDDGFADNLYTAKPLLEHAGVPATVYVTTGPIGTTDEFWWDELDHLVLLPERLPSELQLSVRGRVRHWTLGRASAGAWAPGAFDASQRARATFHREVWEFLLPLAHDEQRRVLDDLRRWSQVNYQPRSSHRTMHAGEIARLASGGLIEIGAHTVTHPHLPSVSASNWRLEIEGSRRSLESVLGHAPSSFSYPYGAVPESISTLVHDIGFESAVATHEQSVWRGDDVRCLPRFGVRDWDGTEFERRFAIWLKQYAEP